MNGQNSLNTIRYFEKNHKISFGKDFVLPRVVELMIHKDESLWLSSALCK